jgi:hypothetical protein
MKKHSSPDAGQLPTPFPLGQIVATPGALRLLEQHAIAPVTLLARHATRDWGVVPVEDAAANEQALIHGERILSSYPVGDARVWIITEWDRSFSTLLLPDEY